MVWLVISILVAFTYYAKLLKKLLVMLNPTQSREVCHWFVIYRWDYHISYYHNPQLLKSKTYFIIILFYHHTLIPTMLSQDDGFDVQTAGYGNSFPLSLHMHKCLFMLWITQFLKQRHDSGLLLLAAIVRAMHVHSEEFLVFEVDTQIHKKNYILGSGW